MPVDGVDRFSPETARPMVPGRVSIIIPAFNGGTFIAQAIDSVRGQTYENWELAVVDDQNSNGGAHASILPRCTAIG